MRKRSESFYAKSEEEYEKVVKAINYIYRLKLKMKPKENVRK